MMIFSVSVILLLANLSLFIMLKIKNWNSLEEKKLILKKIGMNIWLENHQFKKKKKLRNYLLMVVFLVEFYF